MPTIPPWIVTPDAAGRYTQGFGLGLDVASKRAAQSAQQANMALQMQSMAQKRKTDAEIASREAIRLQLDEQYRSATMLADSNKLAQQQNQFNEAQKQALQIQGMRDTTALAVQNARSKQTLQEPITEENIKKFPLTDGSVLVTWPGGRQVVSSGNTRTIKAVIEKANAEYLIGKLNDTYASPEDKAAAQAELDKMIAAESPEQSEPRWRFVEPTK